MSTEEKLDAVNREFDNVVSSNKQRSRTMFRPYTLSTLLFKDKSIPAGTDNVLTFHISPKPGINIGDLITAANKYIDNNHLNNISVQNRKVGKDDALIIKVSGLSPQEARELVTKVFEHGILPDIDSIKGSHEIQEQKELQQESSSSHTIN